VTECHHFYPNNVQTNLVVYSNISYCEQTVRSCVIMYSNFHIILLVLLGLSWIILWSLLFNCYFISLSRWDLWVFA